MAQRNKSLYRASSEVVALRLQHRCFAQRAGTGKVLSWPSDGAGFSLSERNINGFYAELSRSRPRRRNLLVGSFAGVALNHGARAHHRHLTLARGDGRAALTSGGTPAERRLASPRHALEWDASEGSSALRAILAAINLCTARASRTTAAATCRRAAPRRSRRRRARARRSSTAPRRASAQSRSPR